MLDTILAFSDSHGKILPEKLLSVAAESKYIFFLGDGANGIEPLSSKSNFFGVKGNCDYGCGFPRERVVIIGNTRILLTHGDLYRVKYDLLPLALRAKELDCSAAFYGHTHFASIDEHEGVTLICPGALSAPTIGAPSYAYATVYNGKLSAKIVNLMQIC